jgi:hypothetical protein
LANLQVKWLHQVNDFGFRSFIPFSMTDPDQYWHGTKEKPFALAKKLGLPIFFLTFTMNSYWPEYQNLKRGTGAIPDTTYNSGLSECPQKEFIETIDTPDLPPHILNLYEGDPCVILRNISTLSGVVKGSHCWAQVTQRAGWVTLDNDQNVTLPRIPTQKVANGIKFRRWQIPLKLVYAGTVHCSQGMTLNRAVIDLRALFWEHGQLYVALSRATDPRNLRMLFLDDQD